MSTDDKIISAWRMFEDQEPDISTERLMEQTATFCKCDSADVAEALLREAKRIAQGKRGPR